MARPTPATPAPIEEGAVETEMHDDSGAPGVVIPIDGVPIEEPIPPAPQAPTDAELTGPEMAEIRLRNEAVDKANKAAAAAQEAALQAARLAQYAQEALTQLINNLIAWKGLDRDYRYQVDLDRGRIVNRGRSGPPMAQ